MSEPIQPRVANRSRVTHSVTIKTDVNPPSSTAVRRSFTGALSLPDGSVPATVEFENGSVRLYVVGDPVGRWPRQEVTFRPTDGGYELHAEGDFLRFQPDQVSDFDDFVGAPTPTPPPPSPQNGTPAVPVDAPPIRPPRPVDTPPDLGRADPPSVGAEHDLFGPLPAATTNVAPEDPPGLLVDEAADEFFAAGLDGPPTEESPGPTPNLPHRPIPRALERRPAMGEPIADPQPHTIGQSAVPPTDADRAPKPIARTQPDDPPAPSPVTGPVEAVPPPGGEAKTEAAASTEDIPEEAASVVVESPRPEPVATPATPSTREKPSAGSAAGTPGRFAQLIRQAASQQPAPEKPASPPPPPATTEDVEPEGDDVPEALTDEENLRQWGLVIGGAIVVLVILGVAVWGVISLVGGGDPATEETVATTPTTEPPPLTTTTTSPPPPAPTVSPENAAAAAAFVDGWNAIASQYGYHHLIVAGESLPLSTAPVPAVHLVYDENGGLELSMAPKGTGADRDILVAMGIAVAWADPAISPEARRDVLGALGVDVDDPKVSDMGGELTRNGVAYSLEVVNDVIRFSVRPGS